MIVTCCSNIESLCILRGRLLTFVFQFLVIEVLADFDRKPLKRKCSRGASPGLFAASVYWTLCEADHISPYSDLLFVGRCT